MFNNKLLFININAYQLYANLLIILIASLFLTALDFYVTISLATITILSSLYTLRWSIKNHVYHSEEFIQFTLSKTVLKSLPNICFHIFRTVFFAVSLIVVISILNWLNKLNHIRYNEDYLLFTFLKAFMILGIICITMFFIISIMVDVENFTDNLFKDEKRKISKIFKLNTKETFFIVSDYTITNFITGKFMKLDDFICYEDTRLNSKMVRKYLKEENLTLLELTPEHLKIIEMYGF